MNKKATAEFSQFCKLLPSVHPHICSNSPTHQKSVEDQGRSQAQALNWSHKCQATFEKLKHLFIAKPVLKHPDLDEPFVIQEDSSHVAMGEVLLQKNAKGELQP